jgi:hypothetical protein
MGDTTYNHVYGSTTTGDITRAMQATASAASGAGLLRLISLISYDEALVLTGHGAVSTGPPESSHLELHR